MVVGWCCPVFCFLSWLEDKSPNNWPKVVFQLINKHFHVRFLSFGLHKDSIYKVIAPHERMCLLLAFVLCRSLSFSNHVPTTLVITLKIFAFLNDSGPLSSQLSPFSSSIVLWVWKISCGIPWYCCCPFNFLIRVATLCFDLVTWCISLTNHMLLSICEQHTCDQPLFGWCCHKLGLEDVCLETHWLLFENKTQ